MSRDDAPRIVALAVPMMAASLAVAVAQLLTLGMLGHLGHEALYIRAAYTPIVFAFLALGEALAASTQVVTAVSRGRGEDRAGLATAAWLLALGVIGSALLAGACWLLAPELARFVGAPAGAAGGLTTFARWMPAATVPVVIPLVIAAALRGTGRAAAAAAVTVTYLLVDLATVAVVAFAAHGGVLSLAWANATGAAVATALGLVMWARGGLPGRAASAATGAATRAGERLARAARGRALRVLRDVGLPIVLSYGALFAFGLLVVRILRQFGPAVVSGFSVGYSVQTLAIVPAIALGSAGAIVVNHLDGAGRADEAPAAFAGALRLAARIYAAAAALVTALAVVLPPLISSSPAVAHAGLTYLLVCGPSLLALGIVLMTLTVLEQTGAARSALVLNLVNVVAVAVVGGALARHFGSPVGLYATSAVAAVAGMPAVLALGRRHVAGLGCRHDAGDVGAVATADARPCLEAIGARNRDAVHELFCAPDFLFKTTLPWLADPAEIDALLTADTRVITVAGEVVGLVELEPASAEAGHHRIHYRLRSAIGPERCAAVLEAIIATARDEHDILRVTLLVHDGDQRGHELARRCGLEDEGALAGTTERRGRRGATRFYARVYGAGVGDGAAGARA